MWIAGAFRENHAKPETIHWAAMSKIALSKTLAEADETKKQNILLFRIELYLTCAFGVGARLSAFLRCYGTMFPSHPIAHHIRFRCKQRLYTFINITLMRD